MIKMSCKSVSEFYFILNAEQNQRFTPKTTTTTAEAAAIGREEKIGKTINVWVWARARFFSFAMNVNNEYIFYIYLA